MSTTEPRAAAPAELRTLQGRERLLLDDRAGAYLIESGAVALVSSEVAGGVPAGRQRLLARLGPGQAVFSSEGLAPRDRRLFVVPVEDATLRVIGLASHGRGSARDLHERLDGWIELLARLLEGEPPAGPSTRIRAEREYRLEEGQVLGPRRRSVVWVRVLEGALGTRGEATRSLLAGPSWVPLGSGMWLRVMRDARFETSTTRDLGDPANWLAGLARLHGQVLDHLTEQCAREAHREQRRLRDSTRAQDEHVERELSDLVGVLQSRDPPLVGENLLEKSMVTLGRSLGVEVRPPAESEDPARPGETLEAIARASHLRLRHVRLQEGWWHRDCGALLGFRGERERTPLALVPQRSGRYQLFDPSDDSRVALDARLAAGLAHEAVQVYRPLPSRPLGILDLVRFALARRGHDFALVLLTGLAATLLGMVTPLAMALLMDHAIPNADRGMLLEIGAGLLFAAFGATLFIFSRNLVLLRIGVHAESATQTALWDRLLRLRPSFFRRFSSGDLQARVMAVDDVGQAVSSNATSALFAGLLALLNFGLLCYYSLELALVALGVALAILATTLTAGVYLQRNVARTIELEGSLFGFVVQLLNGIGKLRVAGAEKRAFARWLHDYARQLVFRNRAHAASDAIVVLNQVLPALGLALLLLFAHDKLAAGREGVQAGALSLGSFLAFNTALATFLGGVTALSLGFVEFLDVFTKTRRVGPILREEPEADISMADPGRLSGRLSVESLCFHYEDGDPDVLEDVSLRVEPGEFVAIVGPSGGGKSTLLRMLLGFESPTSGSVRYDGRDLSTLDVLAVRRQIGVVLQGGAPDASSIFENISSGNPITLDEAWAAAEDAELADDLRRMPMGMHTLVSVGGANLSGGQRQRLLIARALAQRPRILLLDEATSALDNRTQEAVSEGLERLKVTRLVIAHRLSTIRRADSIYVLEDGRIVQRGTYDELMGRAGLFRRMMSRQFLDMPQACLEPEPSAPLR